MLLDIMFEMQYFLWNIGKKREGDLDFVGC
jgi:hypothetical protein